MTEEIEGQNPAAQQSAASQSSIGGSTPLTTGETDRPRQKDGGEGFARRMADKAQRLAGELAETRAALEAERAEQDRLKTELETTRRRATRAEAIVSSGLPAELAELVPEADEETVATYVDKLKPLAERLGRPPIGGTPTNPAGEKGASSEEARAQRLAELAAAGDRRALEEWMVMRERRKATA